MLLVAGFVISMLTVGPGCGAFQAGGLADRLSSGAYFGPMTALFCVVSQR